MLLLFLFQIAAEDLMQLRELPLQGDGVIVPVGGEIVAGLPGVAQLAGDGIAHLVGDNF